MALTPLVSRQPSYPRISPLKSEQFTAPYFRGFFPASRTGPIRGAHTSSWLLNTRPVLETDKLRRLASWGVPGICTSTLLHQLEGLEWQIVNKDGKNDYVTDYYTELFQFANDGQGGFSDFLQRLASDMLACKTGAFIEIPRNFDGVPTALYNVDGATMRKTHPDDPFLDPRIDPVKYPYAQHYFGRDEVYFELPQVLHMKWRPFPDAALDGHNLTPIQIAYNAIFMLASGDDYNVRVLSDELPNGIINLGEGFDQRTALEWKSMWEADMASNHSVSKLAVLYGTNKIDYQAFAIPPKDMAFSETAYWYACLVASAFELSPLDIGIAISRVSTGAAANQQAGLAKRQGLTALTRKLIGGINRHILPRGYSFRFDNIDWDDDRTRAAIAQMETQGIGALVESLGPEAGLLEATAKGILSAPDVIKKAVAWQAQKQADALAMEEKKASLKAANDETSNTVSPKRDNGSNQVG